MNWVDTTTAIGTAGAALVALVFGGLAEVRAHLSQRQLVALEQARAAHEEKSQAVRVSAWLETHPIEGASPYVRSVAVLLNASDEPIWDVEVNVPTVGFDEEGQAHEAWQVLRFPVLGPGARVEREASWTPPDDWGPLGVKFRDNSHRNWHLSDEGLLTRAFR